MRTSWRERISLREFVARAGLLVLASHSPELLRKVCNKAMLLEHGQIVAFGPLEEVLAIYAERY